MNMNNNNRDDGGGDEEAAVVAVDLNDNNNNANHVADDVVAQAVAAADAANHDITNNINNIHHRLQQVMARMEQQERNMAQAFGDLPQQQQQPPPGVAGVHHRDRLLVAEPAPPLAPIPPVAWPRIRLRGAPVVAAAAAAPAAVGVVAAAALETVQQQHRQLQQDALAAQDVVRGQMDDAMRMIDQANERLRQVMADMAAINVQHMQQQADMAGMIFQQHHATTRLRLPMGPISPVLFDLIRDHHSLPCRLVLPGAVCSCQAVLDRIASNPEEVYFTCPATRSMPLHQAAAHCHCLCVLRAIVNVEPRLASSVDAARNTPLHWLLYGCAQKSVAPQILTHMVQLLLQANPSSLAVASNQKGHGPLHVACARGASESMIPPGILNILLPANAAAAARTTSVGELPLHWHCNRRNASVNMARLLVQFHPPGIHQKDRTEQEWTALHYACAKANTALILYLVETDPPAASVRAKNGETPLHVLCRQKQLLRGGNDGNNNNDFDDDDDDDVPYLAVMRALIRAAPETVVWKTLPLTARDVMTRRTVTNTGYTPLHYLLRESRSPRSVVPLSLVQALVKASPSCAAIPDGNQYLPLHYACEAGSNASVDVIACLLSAHADSVQAVTRQRDTALHLACATNKTVETVRLLLQQYPAATLMANEYGFIPLHCLARAYQPSLAICQALLEASPTSIHVLTKTGESAVHLATSNCSVSAAVLACLTRAAAVPRTAALQDKPKKKKPLKNSSFAENLTDGKRSSRSTPRIQTNGTPLHEACISRREQIESIATLHPEWITVGNNAGFTPLQILCKSGCMDDASISLFSRIAGPTSFQAVDLMGNTPLHYAMREETNVEAAQALIRAFPEALHMKTIYDDTPLHLACLRRVDPMVVAEVAISSCAGMEQSLAICNQRMSPLLMENTAGQTPIAIAMQEFQKSIQNMESPRGNFLVHQELDKEQQRSFDVLAALVKILHYGPPLAAARHNNNSANDYNDDNQSLVHACVALHRKSVRLHPVFIRRALRDNPDEARLPDGDGNYPLHIEAGIPVEKMFMLNGPKPSRCGESCHDRMGILPVLLEMFPEAAKIRSGCGTFPLGLMVTSGRPWDDTFAYILRFHPEAFHWINGITSKMVPHVISKVARTCGTDTLYALIHSRPDFISNASGLSVHVSTSAASNTRGDIVEESINSQQQS